MNTEQLPTGGSSDDSLQLINQGAYGCIYHPGINCQGKKENKLYITKIQKSARTNENEITISKMIRKIKGYIRYFSPVIKQCPVKIQKKYGDEVRQCELFENMTNQDIQKSSYVSNKIRYVGKYTLLKHIMHQSSPDKLVKEIFGTHLYLLKAVELLASKKIVHYDLKYNNIMYDDKIKHPIIIDFGLSMYIPNITEKNVDNRFYVFETYSYWCFEIHILNYITQVITISRSKNIHFTEKDIQILIDSFIYGSDYVKNSDSNIKNDIFNNSITLPKQIEEYKKSITNAMSKQIGNTWNDIYETMIKTYESWDGYSLAVIYLFILDDIKLQMERHYKYINIRFKQQMEEYREYLSSIIYSIPTERISVFEMREKLTSISESIVF